MPSYVVAGASRGIGYAFLQYLSKDSQNVVIGLARDKVATEQKVHQEGLTNVTILKADIVDRQSLIEAKDQVVKLIGGSLDYLINNAAFLSPATAGRFLDEFEDDPKTLEDNLHAAFETNVIGVINTINVFLPLIKKSHIKKVVTLTSGMGDLDVVNGMGVWEGAPYSISKAALNLTVAKYNARYKDDGILFLAISPGVVDTGAAPVPGMEGLFQKFLKAAPDFKGPMQPLESVEAMLKVIESKSVEGGDGGAFISHHGDKNWL